MDEWRCQLICGGFPCTDISSSGLCRGIAGPQSGLWYEMLRIICILRPKWVLLENVADIVYRGLGEVLGGLAQAGYDAEWQCLPAAVFGAPQRRDRMFIIAYPAGSGFEVYAKHNCQPEDDQPQQPQTSWNYVDGLALAEDRTKQAPAIVWGMDDAVPHRVDRLRCLGNAVVPQVAEFIGRMILEATRSNT